VLPDRTVECTHVYICRGDDYRERWDNPGAFGAPETIDGLSSIEQIRITEEFRCAVRADGEVFCWGYKSDAQLGNGKTGPGTQKGEFVSPEFAPRD